MCLASDAFAQTTARPTPMLAPIPAVPRTPSPGRPGDFDFLTGAWRITNWKKKGDTWDVFEGEATVHAILGGTCSIEELRIPARDFSGMGLRLLDAKTRVWSDHWVNAKSGVIVTPGQTGSFENGAGIFASEEREGDRTIIAVGVWDAITPRSCRWRQAVSEDGGSSWDQGWIMEWRRA